jgi:hypothetical protein
MWRNGQLSRNLQVQSHKFVFVNHKHKQSFGIANPAQRTI